MQIGDRVKKKSGSDWHGRIVGQYSTDLTEQGWDVESEREVGSVQIYPEAALLPVETASSIYHDHPYLELLDTVRRTGVYREGRNGGTYGLFGHQMRFNLRKGFPLLTTKKVHWKSVAVELLWFLRGETNVRYLQGRGVTIWNEWSSPDGELGPVYGAQWRSWQGEYHPTTGFPEIDQIRNVVEALKSDPHSRRHIVTAWNPAEIDDMALPPCHCLFQFFVSDGRLSCQLYQRSADVFLGVPFNIASYALLTHLIAAEVGLEVGDFVHSFGDVHLYANHVEQAIEQCKRLPVVSPTLRINSEGKSILDGSYEWTDFTLENYDPHPAIRAEVSK